MADTSIATKSAALALSKREHKILKISSYLDILEFCITRRLGAVAAVLLNFPLQREEYTLTLDGAEKTFAVAMRSTDFLRELKFTNVFKAQATADVSMGTLNSILLKWLSSERRTPNTVLLPEPSDLLPVVHERLEHCMRAYFRAVHFSGTVRAFVSREYPRLV